MRARTSAVCGLVTLVASAAWAQVPLGPEFQVNSYTTDFQIYSSIGADSAGNFVIAWQSYAQDGSSRGIFARKYTAAAAPLGASEFRVNAFTTGSQGIPQVASDPTGRFVVTWQSDQRDADQYGVAARRYDASATPGPEFLVNTYTTSQQMVPKLAMDAAGDFVVAWQSLGQDGDGFGIFAQRYNAAGSQQGGEFQVNDAATDSFGPQREPSVGMDAAGNFVIAWTSNDASGNGVFARRYNASGVPQGAEFAVNGYTSNNQNQTAVAMAGDGSFLLTWTSFGQDGDGPGVYARSYNASGVPQGLEFRINQRTIGTQNQSRACADPAGGFVVVWATYDVAPGTGQIMGRAFTAAGAARGDEFQVNTYSTAGIRALPSVICQPGQRFVTVWQGPDQDQRGIFARRLATDVIFADDFESGSLAGWSSSTTDGGDLYLSALAAMRSSGVGMAGLVDDTTSLFVQDDTPVDEDHYRARFYLDTNGFDPGEASGAHRTRTFIVFEEAPTRRLAAIVLKRQAGVYAIEGRCRLDSGAQADTGFFTIGAGPHAIEIDWKRASSAVASDGTFELWIDGVSKTQLTGLSNSISSVDFVRLGALSVKPGASGTLYWDEFESRRMSYIGN